jgi:hypothetical protein
MSTAQNVLLCLLSAVSAVSGTRTQSRVALHAEFRSGRLSQSALFLALINASDRPVWVNRRMLVGLPGASDGRREIWLDVTGPSGAVDFRCKVDALGSRAEDYIVLFPGQSVGREYDLAQCYILDNHRKYSVTAHFQDSSHVPAPAGVDELKEVITAAPVALH